MHNIALSWQQAATMTGVLGLGWCAFRVSHAPAANSVVPWARELCIIAGLYSLWQLAGKLSVTGTSGALSRSETIERIEHDVRLPSERTVQNLIVHHSTLTQAANLYYASMHFAALFALLGWLFLRHRDHYAAVRTTVALTTLVCLLIQLMPVAPPRLLPGYVDTAAVYGQSVYSLGFGTDELSAMPSVHVAWAVLVAWYVVRISTSRWRWLPALHAPVTVFVVLATGNHWWLDGFVAVAVLVACSWARYALGRVMIAIRVYARPRLPEALSPARVTNSSEAGVQA